MFNSVIYYIGTHLCVRVLGYTQSLVTNSSGFYLFFPLFSQALGFNKSAKNEWYIIPFTFHSVRHCTHQFTQWFIVFMILKVHDGVFDKPAWLAQICYVHVEYKLCNVDLGCLQCKSHCVMLIWDASNASLTV